MPKKKQPESRKQDDPNVMGLRAEVLEQPICQTLESNYMPYAMSVIVSRAIPEIDGFKPSHRKLLYTMYEMGLLTKPRTKSANIVGQTMKLNPHGDAAIYETMVRLARGNETLLHPFVDSKGNFGKVYSRDMAYAASRYTEAKLEPICQELFRDIDADTDKLMQKLFKTTTLQDAFGCNFNILIAGMPRVMGVREILQEWTAWRTECVRRRLYFQMNKKKDKLHLLKGLGRILLDIDKAIAIIRETELDAEVVPNLMIGFGIDQIQAEYVAEIKLRNINKEFILNRLKETESLEKEIAELEATLGSEKKVQSLICKELEQVAQKYGKERKTTLVYDHELQQEPDDEPENDYPVTVFLSREGYFKKITAQSLRMSGEQKFKEGDSLLLTCPAQNSSEMLVFTDKYQVYKTRISDFADGKASALGDYLPGKLGFDEGESFLTAVFPGKYEGNLLFVFENGKAAKIAASCYDTKSNRKRLTGAYSDKSPVRAIIDLPEEKQIVVRASDGRALIFSTAQLAVKTTRSAQGVAVMSLKRKAVVESAAELEKTPISNVGRYSARTLPAAGALVRPEDIGETQMKLDI